MSAKPGTTWVGVAGFEPAASSSRTKDSTQAGDTADAVTSNDMSHGTTSHPTGIPIPDAPVTHGMLPYDQIPAERRTILDYAGNLRDHADMLGIKLAEWAARDDTKADPMPVLASNRAMEEIDAILYEMTTLRARLVSERRRSDDAFAARAAARR